MVYQVSSESDLVIHAGDFTEGHVLRDLERMAPLKGVLGNMDEPDLAHLLPLRLDLTLEGLRVCVAHGHGPPWNLAERVLSMFRGRPDVLIYGHSHAFHSEVRNGTLILNPGSTCGPRGSRSMAILTLEAGADPVVERVPL